MQWKSESRAVMSDSLRPMDYTVHGILQARRDLPNPGIKSRSPILQADSLPSESPSKSIYFCCLVTLVMSNSATL